MDQIDDDFVNFVRERSATLYATAFLLTGSRTDSEDLLQDVLAALYPKWDQVAAAQSSLAYVRRSLVNRYISQARTRRFALASSDWGAVAPEFADSTDLIAAVGDRAQLRDILGQVPPKQRAAIVLRYYHDLDEAGIAAALGCRPATVRSLINRGLRSIRAAAAGHDVADATGTTKKGVS